MKPPLSLYDRIQTAVQAARQPLDAQNIETAIVLGSGLATIAERVTVPRSMLYSAVPGFPQTTVAGHPGRMVCGTWAGRKVLLFCGRVHGYEGVPPSDVGFGVRVAAALGAKVIILTSVVGGIDTTLQMGELVALRDHINLTGVSPLTGPNDDRLGPRFVDMTEPYSPALRQLARAAAQELFGAPLQDAVYGAMPGPAYETPAEVRMLRLLGATVVGMSTVSEVICARHAGLDVLALSLVTNPAAGVRETALRHDDVTSAASTHAERMATLLEGVIARLPRRT
jgi:purine-nucleoside phosphorylase